MLPRRVFLAGVAGATAAMVAGTGRAAATPLTLSTPAGRAVAVSRWVPAGARRGRLAFSHGAASAPWKYDAMILPLVAAGWEVFAPLHVDSTDHPDTKKFPGLTSWQARIEDMRALSDHLGPGRYSAAGHSYGALTALMLGGAEATLPAGVRGPLIDKKVDAVLAFSPPAVVPALISAAGYAALAVPAMIETGTHDVFAGAPGGLAAWRQHLDAYQSAAPGGNRYAMVLDGVDHYFGGAICRPELAGPAQRAQLNEAVDLSLLFLDAFAQRRAKARALLDARLSDTGPVALMRK